MFFASGGEGVGDEGVVLAIVNAEGSIPNDNFARFFSLSVLVTSKNTFGLRKFYLKLL